MTTTKNSETKFPCPCSLADGNVLFMIQTKAWFPTSTEVLPRKPKSWSLYGRPSKLSAVSSRYCMETEANVHIQVSETALHVQSIPVLSVCHTCMCGHGEVVTEPHSHWCS